MRADPGRVLATLIIWLMCGGIAITGLVNGVFLGGWSVLSTIVSLMAAMAATRLLWKIPESTGEGEKAKRRGRIDHLLDELSDDEIDQLRARLSDSDGEISLEDVLRKRR